MKICNFAFVLIIQRKPFRSFVLYILQEKKCNSSGAHKLNHLFMVIKMMRRLKIKRCFPFFSVLYMLYFIYIPFNIVMKLVCVRSVQRETEAGWFEWNMIFWWIREVVEAENKGSSLLSMLDHRASKHILEKSIFCV